MKWKAVHDFWFKKHNKDDWFKKDNAFDAEIKRRFLELYWEVVRGEHADWRNTAKGRLSEILVLDQFSRNMFRGDGQTFAHDRLALALAQEAIRAGAEKTLNKKELLFLYLPFMHSESPKIQRESIRLFTKYGDKEVLWFAKDHQKVVQRFGRFPHRNKARRIKSTKAETAFMKSHKGY